MNLKYDSLFLMIISQTNFEIGNKNFEHRQTFMFSATMPPEVEKLMNDKGLINITTHIDVIKNNRDCIYLLDKIIILFFICLIAN